MLKDVNILQFMTKDGIMYKIKASDCEQLVPSKVGILGLMFSPRLMFGRHELLYLPGI